MKNIYEKMLEVTKRLWVVEKNLSVAVSSTNKYKAVSERDILDAVKPLEAEVGIYSYPVEREIIKEETLIKKSDYNGQQKETYSFLMRIKVLYRFVNIDNPQETVDMIVYWDGIDTGDKAPGKAMTYADKYALMKAYKISTGDDPDKEASPQEWYKKEEKSEKKQKFSDKNFEDFEKVKDDYKNGEDAVKTILTKYELTEPMKAKVLSLYEN